MCLIKTIKMKVAVTMNDDGHFLVSSTSEREECLDILKRISDGEFFEDLYEDALDTCDLTYDDLFDCPLNRFEQFLYRFEERGRFELVEI